MLQTAVSSSTHTRYKERITSTFLEICHKSTKSQQGGHLCLCVSCNLQPANLQTKSPICEGIELLKFRGCQDNRERASELLAAATAASTESELLAATAAARSAFCQRALLC